MSFRVAVVGVGRMGKLHARVLSEMPEAQLVCVVDTNLAAATILLDGRLIDFKKPVALELNGKTSTRKLQPSLRTLCETLQRRGDPELAFTAEIVLPLPTWTSPR